MAGKAVNLRSAYEEERQALETKFRTSLEPEAFLTGHSDLIDRLVRDICRPALEKQQFVVLATAGYGRREQYPGSDVDLLVVHDFADEALAQQVISPILNQLWDVRLALGQQVWSLNELRELEMSEFEFVLALFDGRIVTGSQTLGSEVLRLHRDFVAAHREELANRIVDLVRRRHEKAANTVYQLEPEVKESPGGLRDHLAGTWLRALVGDPPYLPYSAVEIQEAHLYLMRLRILVHLEHRRPDNRLTHRVQERLAAVLGHSGTTRDSGVESLMKTYFLNARIMTGFCLAMLHAARPEETDSPLLPQEMPPLDSMTGLLEVFQLAIDESRPLSAQARSKVQGALSKLSREVDFPRLRDPVMDLLRPRAGLYRTLSDLYELGVLEILFPEFTDIKARVIRDFYHRYTVDEHTLIAIKSIEDLVTGEIAADPRFGTILRDSVAPSHLVLALLLHDVGKAKDGAHTEESARIASRVLRRFRFGREEIDTVLFLIRQHLAMSGVIFRRDIDDEEVVNRFADLVGETERLRLLTLLTYADIKAVAPGVLNDWKKDLLWQLYLDTYRKLTLDYGDERVEEEDIGERLLKRLEPGLDPFDFERFLEGFPTRYLRTTPPREVFEHYRMALRLNPANPLESSLLRRKNFYELCVVTPDRQRLFARIVGLLSYFEMDILRGFGFANRRQTILDIIHFADDRKVFRHAEERDRFQQLLLQAVKEEISIEDLLRPKEQSVLFRRKTPWFEPTLYFEDEHSERFTILEIIAPDAMGLLYRISRAIAQLDCDIDLVLINTEGHRAVDVFYLCHRGGKLSPELKENLSDRIIEAIGTTGDVSGGVGESHS